MKNPKATARKKAEHTREEKQEQALVVVNALHDISYSTLTIESQQMTRGVREGEKVTDYWCRIIIEREEIGPADMTALLALCDDHGAEMSLKSDTVNGLRISRLSLWPRLS